MCLTGKKYIALRSTYQEREEEKHNLIFLSGIKKVELLGSIYEPRLLLGRTNVPELSKVFPQ